MDVQVSARLFDWGARVLYIGPALGLTPHRNAAGVLAVALDGTIGVADDPRARAPSWRVARSVLILPNGPASPAHRGRPYGFSSTSIPSVAISPRCACGWRDEGPRAAFDLADEGAAIELLTDIAARRLAAEQALRRCCKAARRRREREGRCPHCCGPGADARRPVCLTCARRSGEVRKAVAVALPAFVQGGDRRAATPLRIWNRIGAAAAAIAQGASLDGSGA